MPHLLTELMVCYGKILSELPNANIQQNCKSMLSRDYGMLQNDIAEGNQ